MAYATVQDVQARMTRLLSESEQTICSNLLDDAAVIIDTFNSSAVTDSKKVVSIRMVIRALGDGESTGVPMGATQGSMSGLSYSQSWTIGNGGGVGELYLGRLDKQMLGYGNKIGSHSPLEDFGGANEGNNSSISG
jgi:hypothetical protein